MSKESRKLARLCIYFTLVLGLSVEGGLGDLAISGCCVGDIKNGAWVPPQPQSELWPWIAGLVAVQGILILALLRLRDPKLPDGLFISERPSV